LEGWFVAPQTTDYRFSLACDDNCQFLIDSTPGSTTNAVKIVESIGEYYGYRQGWMGVPSAWVSLTAG